MQIITYTFRGHPVELPYSEANLALARQEAEGGITVAQGEAHSPTPQADTDAILIDHEYRLTLLELGITE